MKESGFCECSIGERFRDTQVIQVYFHDIMQDKHIVYIEI